MYCKSHISIGLSVALAATLTCPCAFADEAEQLDEAEDTSNAIPTERQYVVESTAVEYENALAELNALKAEQAELQESIDAIEAHLDEIRPAYEAQLAKSNKAISTLYKMQSESAGLLEFILEASTFEQFVTNFDYLAATSKTQLAETNRLAELKREYAEGESELEESKAALEESIAAADAAASELREVLYLAQDARAEAQAAAGATDGVDWSMTEEEFIAEWAPRIDAYFAGTPMADTGTYFAAAAWRYGIDPRYSPAISCVESSKGQYCIKAHNAWGWGAADSDPYGLASSWATWETAINTHVRGLARGYGYTVSLAAAKKYCSSWEKWYEGVSSEMAKI